MHRSGRRALIAAASVSLALASVATTVATADAKPTPGADTPAPSAGQGSEPKHYSDDFATQKQQKQDDLRQKALTARLQGKKWAQSDVVRFPRGQAVDLSLEETDKIFAVIVEFGDTQYETATEKRFVGPPPDGSATDVTGPLHNEIAPPNRAIDNSTLWQDDYSREHYENMYFNRMREYYETQSSGRYTIDGDVTEWVKVPYNEALYGRNYCGSIVCPTSRVLVRDALAMWVDSQLHPTDGSAPMTMAAIQEYLKTFDHEDRYDIDNDENFDEPDGVIDHFQIVHAGGDEAAGDPHQGTDAIWSHRSGANVQAGGPLGVGVNVGSSTGPFSTGGETLPNNPTGMWVYDYTVQPENGGLGVFAHEFGHDLGLPDLYDTSGNTGGAENNTAFWTLMSSGANIGDGGPDGIGDNPTDMGAWEKLVLGWLEPQGKKGPFYAEVPFGETRDVALGPNTPVTKKPSALVMPLPAHEQDLGAPDSGDWMFWSGSGPDFESTMTHPVTAAAATPVKARVRYQIEEDWDYAYLEASDGTTWTPLDTNLSRDTNPNDQNDGNGITGTTNGAWVDLTATAPAGTTAIRFRYWTDPFTNGQGFFVDNVSVGGQVIGTAETADEGWTFATRYVGTGTAPATLPKFDRTKQTVEGTLYDHFYIAEYRQHDGYDKSLATAYNFGFTGAGNKPDWVETHPYMEGLLVWYWDTQYSDNNVGDHPGHGELLPVDAHPQFSHWQDGTLMRNRILSYDSTFGLKATQALTLHNQGVAARVPSRPAVRTFDDTKQWWFPADEHTVNGIHPGRYQPAWYSVDVPKTGSTIRVNGFGKKGAQINLTVN
jgi:immune inhibitor A